MGWGDVLEGPGFVLGAVCGGLSLVVLMGLVAWIARRTAARPTAELDSYHVGKLLRSLHRWTDGFAHDVSRYRQFVHGIQEQVARAEQLHSPHADSAWLLKVLSSIVQANEQLQHRLDNAEQTLQEQASEISSYISEARTDPLTGLANRRVFDNELAEHLMSFRRQNIPLAMLIIDIDHFKKFNDRYGHLAGDAVLRFIAGILRGAVRESDRVARLGGEEFAIVLPGSDAADASRAAERLREAVARAVLEYEGKKLRVTISCGGAAAQAGEEAQGIVKRADQALYASKAAGRDFATWHNGQELIPITCRRVATLVEHNRTTQRSEEFARICDELRRKLLDVVSQDA